MSVVGGASLIDAEITEDPNQDREGSRPRSGPEYTGSLWLRYDQKSGPLEGAFAGLGVVAVGDRFLSDTEDLEVPGHMRWDLSLGYRPDEHQELRLFVRNLFDDDHIENAGFPGGYNRRVAPRTISVAYNLEF